MSVSIMIFALENPIRRTVAIGVVSVILVASLIWIAASVLFGGIAAVFEIRNGRVILPEEFLPDWWLVVPRSSRFHLLVVRYQIPKDRRIPPERAA